MQAKIHLLSEETINQIAAGEVVENPASVVKELVENAIDAGASEILVEVKAGGQQLIRVVDNGSGMGKEDALLSLERFTTSKIAKAHDLFHLSTMGFRGEALASIASVSKMSLHTSTGEKGTLIEVEAGKVVEVATSARECGTTIEVLSLFYNVPARKKFQKSSAANGAEITRMMTALSLAHPTVAFELIQQGTKILSTPNHASNLLSRISTVLGEEFIKESIEIKIEEESFKLFGILGSPMQSRANRTGQHLFINGRPIISPLLSYAVKDGYGTRLDASRHPTYVLHLEIAPDLVDVNVHPQKREVRLRDEKRVRDKVQEAVNLSLQKKERPDFAWTPSTTAYNSFSEPSFSYNSTSAAPSFKFKEEVASFSPPLDLSFKSEARALGLFSPYLFLEEGGELLVVDLIAARARLLFDSLVEEKRGPPESFMQALLFPVILTVSPADLALLETHLEEIEKLGIGVRLSGKETFIVDALPPFMQEQDVQAALMLLVEELEQMESNSIESERMRKLAMVCTRFTKADKKPFLLQEALALFDELMKSSSPYHSPQGKPIILTMSTYEISKLFEKAH